MNEKTMTLAVLPSYGFYSGMGAVLDNLPRNLWIAPRDFASLFVEDILYPANMNLHPDVLRGRMISPENASIDYAVEFILENYDCLHQRLVRDIKKTLPFLLTKPYTLENLFLFQGSYSLALRIAENDNQSFSLPFATTNNL